MTGTDAPPQNLEAEEHVLGSMMLAVAAIGTVREILDAGDFYRESHGRIYRAAVALEERGEPVDPLTLAAELGRCGELDEVGGRVRINEIARLVPASANVAHYARIVREAARRRDALGALATAREALENGGLDETELERVVHALDAAGPGLEEHGSTVLRRFEIAVEFAGGASEEPLRAHLGTEDDVIFPERGLVLMVGPDGGTKTTLEVDLLAHLCAGRQWLLWPVPRPLRAVLIENEGPRAGLRKKIAEKVATWEGEPWAERLLVYSEPWGDFNLLDRGLRADLLAACTEHEADLVAAGPLLGIGATGEGKPGDTQALVDLLRNECGLGTSLAYLLVHHMNKLSQVSGDWRRHPDTILQAERDGNIGRTKLSLVKPPRWGQPREPLILGWIPESKGFALLTEGGSEVGPAEYEQRILDHLAEHPWTETDDLVEEVEGRASELRKARQRLERSGRVTSAPSPKLGLPGKALRWNLAREAADNPVPLFGTPPDEPRPAGVTSGATPSPVPPLEGDGVAGHPSPIEALAEQLPANEATVLRDLEQLLDARLVERSAAVLACPELASFADAAAM